jgi:murein DD-endopeptidase MepM/ murein hydrolase activator NlpD
VGRLIGGAAAALLLVVVLVGAAAAGIVSSLFGGGGGGVCLPAAQADPPAAGASPPAGLSSEQAGNAAAIISVGQQMQVPTRGWVIAIATALQESNLVNLDHQGQANDHDSLGLFQQRPSMGWGSPEQILNPQYAASAFYQRLLQIPDWQTLPLTDAAQQVQRSAFPDAYAQHEPRASEIVQAYLTGTLTDCATGWVLPVDGPLTSGYRTAQRPDHDGIDIAAPIGVTIRAAAAGEVVTVLCNIAGVSYQADDGQPCDRPGYPGLGGCGWYLEILHADPQAGQVVTRYCHLLEQPAVEVGQTVAAGAPIGLVGSSGNSSGPHLHLEVHIGYPATPGNATDPAPFLAARGVAL